MVMLLPDNDTGASMYVSWTQYRLKYSFLFSIELYYDMDLPILKIFWGSRLSGCYCHLDYLCWLDS